jgi:hypothetical protein
MPKDHRFGKIPKKYYIEESTLDMHRFILKLGPLPPPEIGANIRFHYINIPIWIYGKVLEIEFDRYVRIRGDHSHMKDFVGDALIFQLASDFYEVKEWKK